MSDRNVFLVGMMAAGKTAVGRHLAPLLDYDFEDADQAIEARAGADISWIFDMEGEEGFRNREQQVIDELTRRHRMVLATGGGAVLRERNRLALRQRGVVVYLKTAVDRLVERASRDRRRPLLQVANVRERIETLCREREPIYRAVAHVEIATEHKPPPATAAEIVSAIRSASDSPPAGGLP